MSHSDNINYALDYRVLITLRGDLPLDERHKDGIERVTKAIDMIQRIKYIKEIENTSNDIDVTNITEWCDQNGIAILLSEWDKVQVANKGQSKHPVPYSRDPNATNYSFDKSGRTNLNYKVCITMNGNLYLDERNEDALSKLSLYPHIIQTCNALATSDFISINDVFISKESINIFKNIKLTTQSEETPSTAINPSEILKHPEENPREVLADPEEKNHVNISKNQKKHTESYTII